MIQFNTLGSEVKVRRLPEPQDIDFLALVGHLPPGTNQFSLRIIESVVAIERGRGDKLISMEAKDVENWQVRPEDVWLNVRRPSGFVQVSPGRGPRACELDGDYFGHGPRPDCAKIYVPFNYKGSMDITVCGDSQVIIDAASASGLNVHACGKARVWLGEIHCTGKVTLSRCDEAFIYAKVLTARSFDITGDSRLLIDLAMVTPGPLDQQGCPMELRYPNDPRYRYPPDPIGLGNAK